MLNSAPASQVYVVGIDSHNRIQNIHQDAKTNTISILDTVPQTESATTDPYNSTNNVAIPNSLPIGTQMVDVTLSSLNIPKTQYTVESLWNRLFVSEQIELIVPGFDPTLLARTQFSLELSDGAIVTAQLPPYINPITSVQETTSGGLTNLLFTTLLPHGLQLADFWNWGDPIRLTSIGITDPLASTLNSKNPYLAIVSDTSFQLSGLSSSQFVGAFPMNVSGYFGYVWAPGIPGPVVLAQIVTAALNMAIDEYAASIHVSASHVRIYYDLQTGIFVLVVESFRISPTLIVLDPVAIVNGTTSNPPLSFIMGFGNCCIPNTRAIQNQIAVTIDPGHPSLIKHDLPRSGSLNGSFGPLFRTFIDLDIGNYDSATALAFDVELNWNRFYFDPSCTVQTQTSYRFVFIDACGNCFAFMIPFGLYTPESFAQFLQTQMNTATGTSIYQVQYNEQTARFNFATTNSAVFGLKFGDTPFVVFNPQNGLGQSIPVNINQVSPQFATVAVRLGFDNVDYRGQASYTSVRPVFVPRKQLVCNEAVSGSALQNTRRFQFISEWRADGSSIRLEERKRFSVYAFTPMLNAGTLTFSNGDLLVTTPMAAGFQVNDMVKVTLASGTTFTLRVVQLLSPTQFLLDANPAILSALGVTSGGPAVAACVENPTLPIINLYLSQNLYNTNISSPFSMATCTTGVTCNSNPNNGQTRAIAPRLLGMGTEDVLWDPTIGFPFVGVADVVLHFPESLLVVISLDNGKPCHTHTSHLWKYTPKGLDDMSCILAIVPQHHHQCLTWDRHVPSLVQFASPTKAGVFKFVILNPDHTLYQLHNVDWSGTLNITVVQASGQLLS